MPKTAEYGGTGRGPGGGGYGPPPPLAMHLLHKKILLFLGELGSVPGTGPVQETGNCSQGNKKF